MFQIKLDEIFKKIVGIKFNQNLCDNDPVFKYTKAVISNNMLFIRSKHLAMNFTSPVGRKLGIVNLSTMTSMISCRPLKKKTNNWRKFDSKD
jgi:hypothetical protein